MTAAHVPVRTRRKGVTLAELGVTDPAARRREMGLSAEAFAERASVGVATVSRAERGAALRFDIAQRVLAAYGPDRAWRRRFAADAARAADADRRAS